MTNGKCTTWFVAQWLEKHPTHTAKAPRTKQLPDAKASASFMPSWAQGHVFVSVPGWTRSDWTIYNEHGEPVEFKRKRKIRVVGKLCDGERLFVVDDLHISFGLHKCRSPHGYDVLIRERKS